MNKKKLYLCTRKWDGSSVGLERMLDRHEVTSSILVRPTKERQNWRSFLLKEFYTQSLSYSETQNRDVSPVGLERCLHTAEVTGSSPVRPTNYTYIFNCKVLKTNKLH